MALGLAHGPMQAMFWLPNRSIWVAPIITWRLPDQTMSKNLPNGIHDSARRGASGAALTVIGSARARASPSEYTRSGSNVDAARRTAIMGMVPMGLATISPSPRHASAHATTQISALEASLMPGTP